MILTKEILSQIATVPQKAAETFIPYINQYMGEVNTPLRFAAFLANILHESGRFYYVREIASGKAYEGRTDLGNIYAGDGVRFKGRGLIQITGRSNYASISKDLFGNERVLLDNPDLLATPENSVRSAYWFWNKKNLNELADISGTNPIGKENFIKIVKRINGGTNGLAERQKYYEAALKVLA